MLKHSKHVVYILNIFKNVDLQHCKMKICTTYYLLLFFEMSLISKKIDRTLKIATHPGPFCLSPPLSKIMLQNTICSSHTLFLLK